ncbi:extended synaptotagmin-1-like, partial [Eudromia elegans]
AVVDNVPGQDVEFELFDKDLDKDDFLGRCKVPLQRVLSSRFLDEWLPLEGVKSGSLHVRLEILEATRSADALEEALRGAAGGPELSAALLSVFLDRAAELPMRKGHKAPAARASLTVRDVTAHTKTCPPSCQPVWDEGFSFLIKRPHVETLELQVADAGGHPLGSLSLPLRGLLDAPGLVLDGWFPLAGGAPGAQVLLRAQLAILVSQHAGAAPGGDPEPQQEQQEEEEARGGALRQRVAPTQRYDLQEERSSP